VEDWSNRNPFKTLKTYPKQKSWRQKFLTGINLIKGGMMLKANRGSLFKKRINPEKGGELHFFLEKKFH
jgi:hypothetical protein